MTARTASHRTPMERVGVMWANAALALICAAILCVSASVWWPYDPLPKMDVSVIGQPVSGGDMRVRLDYCKDSSMMPHEVRWSLINEILIRVDGPSARLSEGCHVRLVEVPLSPHVMPGRYRVQVDIEYRPWPWRSVLYSPRSVPFEIVETSER